MAKVKLTDVCTIQYGYPFDSKQFSDSEGMPLIRIRDVIRGYSETYTTEEYSDEYVVRQGDMLVGMDGEFNIAKWGKLPALLNQRVCRIIPTDSVYGDYIFYAMPKALKEIEDRTPFVTVKHLSAKEINKIIISLPPLETQRQIAANLDKVTHTIDLCNAILEKLNLLVKSRFVEMFGDLRLNPKGWQVQNFDELSEIITDGEHATPRRKTHGIYLLSARNVLNHAIQLEDVDFIDQDEYDRISKRIVPREGDVLVSCSGSVGRCCHVPAGLKFQMVRSAALIRFKEEISPIFAEYMITSDYVQEQIEAAKTASSQANLFQGKIAKLRGFVPPLELQNKFAAFVEQTDKSKLAVKQVLEKAETLKKALMQEYFG